MRFVIFLFLTSLLVHCGRIETPLSTLSIPTSDIPYFDIYWASASDSDCHYYFKEQKLCATLTWTVGPRVPKESTFILRFWAEGGSAKGPYIEPSGKVQATILMNCCKRPLRFNWKKKADGEYEAYGIRFTVGNWDIYPEIINTAKPTPTHTMVQVKK